MKAVERSVEAAILDEFREIERLGGVLAAVEDRYQRSQIQNAAHRYEQQIYNGTRPIIGLNRYRDVGEEIPEVKLTRTPRKKQQLQVDRLAKFKKKNADKAKRTLDKLADAVERSENCFSMLLEAAEVCSLGQITGRLQEVVGRFRPMV
jgi:methylmalonyl-CoA mutase